MRFAFANRHVLNEACIDAEKWKHFLFIRQFSLLGYFPE